MSLKKKIAKNKVKRGADASGVKSYIIQRGEITPTQHAALHGLKVMIGTPMYGGLCHGQYTNSLITFMDAASKCGIRVSQVFLFNESLIQRGRNNIVHTFMESDCDYLFFLDADIGFAAQNALELILAAKLLDEPLIGATYSKKSINWRQAIRHAKAGVRSERMAHVVGDHVINAAGTGVQELHLQTPLPVKYLGTGFMLIHRSLFDRMTPLVEEYVNDQGGVVVKHPFRTYFDCKVCPDEKRYLSEDYLFCKRAIELGVVPKMAPWINLVHYGSIGFEGCYPCTQTTGAYVHDVLDAKTCLTHGCKCGNVDCNGGSQAI